MRLNARMLDWTKVTDSRGIAERVPVLLALAEQRRYPSSFAASCRANCSGLADLSFTH